MPPRKKKAAGPSYLQIADDLRAQIRSGKLAVGDQLPALAELADSYGVSTSVPRRAFNHLEREGLVHTYQGKGTYVAAAGSDIDPSSALATENVAEHLRLIHGELKSINERLTKLNGG